MAYDTFRSAQHHALGGGLLNPVGTLLDQIGDHVEDLLDPVLPGAGTTVDDVVDTIANILTSTDDDQTGGLVGDLLGNGLLGSGGTGTGGTGGGTGGIIQSIGLGNDGAVLTLDVLGVDIAVLPDNGGIVKVSTDGTIGTGGVLIDLGNLFGKNGLLDLTGLLGGDGGNGGSTTIINNTTYSTVYNAINTGTVDLDDYLGTDGKVDPSKFDEVLKGTEGRDHFTVDATHSVFVDARGEIDTVSFARSSQGLSIAVGGDSVAISDGKELFYMQDVERINFFEGSIYLDTAQGENAGVAYRLYQAAFDRAPDNDGVKYWVKQLDDGLSWKAAADGFIHSIEFQRTYGDLDNQHFVDEIYQNVLGRQGEAAGTSFWLNYLNEGRGDRADVLIGFSESGENIALVGAAIEDGYTVS